MTLHREFYWPTSDDWYPCHPRNTVRVKVDEARTFLRVSVWGADDFGLEKDFPVSEETLREALRLADTLPNPITIAWLKSKGFVNA